MEEVESEWDAWGMIGKASLKELMKQREELSEGGRGCDHEADCMEDGWVDDDANGTGAPFHLPLSLDSSSNLFLYRTPRPPQNTSYSF